MKERFALGGLLPAHGAAVVALLFATSPGVLRAQEAVLAPPSGATSPAEPAQSTSKSPSDASPNVEVSASNDPKPPTPSENAPRATTEQPAATASAIVAEAKAPVALNSLVLSPWLPSLAPFATAQPGAVRLRYPVDYNAGDPNRDAANYARALLGVLAADYSVWQWDWFTNDHQLFEVTREIIGDNAGAGFEYDDDSFKTNFFGHPYHGTLYWGAARGAGLSFWESLPFPWIGSFIWELMGETQKPSGNDFIDTSFGGTVIGEALYRLANEVLDDSLSGSERAFREIGAIALSPSYGLQRVADGRMWRDGHPPRRKERVDVQIEGGINRLTAETIEGDTSYEPSMHAGLDIVYGDLLPIAPKEHIEPYQFFEAYGALSINGDKVGGAQLYIHAPMYGWNSYIGDEGTTHPDNSVVAINQFIDFESANLVEYGSLGLTVGDYLVWRFRKGMRYRLSGDIGPAVLSGVTNTNDSPNKTQEGRTYDFSVGGSVGLTSRFDMKRFGELGFRGRHFLMAVIDGEEGTEVIGHYRFWYDLPLLDRLGIGIAPILVQRSSRATKADPRVTNVSTVLGELYLFGMF